MKLPRQEIKRARIEIIPMIDTIFFLLVFFMITSLSMVQMSAHRVNLPDSKTANEKPLEKVVVSISKEGEYYVDKQHVEFSAIEPYLEDKIHENPSIVVVINCDKDQDVDTFLRVMDVTKQANPASLLIATAPQNPRSAAQ